MEEGDGGTPLIDPKAAGDQAVCRPDVLRDVAGAMSRDLLPQLESAPHKVHDLPTQAVGDWDVARGYADTAHRAFLATTETMGFVAEQVRRIIDDLVATANTVQDGDARAADTARRTQPS
ncbi:hypothetical protein [Nonomuraea rhizosphaerae]|uniref:hypothetical protein n=1 Tax=Nonomuraea rhizosphaerae TaxID=2665663 RepID=UPI001C5F2552|nr:hypothetical protein [Nonomuraea rhizosphaerae]